MTTANRTTRIVPAAAQRRLRAGLLAAWVLAAGALSAAPKQPDLLHKQAPSFVRSDLSGRRIDLRAYRGKVVLLNFWATWCGPCKVELPRFSAWQKQYGPAGLQVIAVSMDDEPTGVLPVVRKLKLDVPVVMGDEKLGMMYGGVLGLPVTFLIGRDGKVDERVDGGADLDAMERRIKQLLAQH